MGTTKTQNMLRTLTARFGRLPRTALPARPLFPHQTAPPRARAMVFVGSGLATARFFCTPISAEGAVAGVASSVPSGALPQKITLYMYSVCPFCNKLKAFLDYHQIPYDVVEVNPLTKKELEFSTYKKVPVAVLDDSTQLNDSGAIIDHLMEQLLAAGRIESQEAADSKQWSEWADTKLVQALTVSIYRTPSESLQAMDYITSHPEIAYATANKYIGAAMMYSLTHLKLKKKYSIEHERPNVYQVIDEWIAAVGSNKFKGGGDRPSRPDLEVFGMLRAIQDMDTFSDIQKNTKIGTWFDAMVAAVENK